MESWPWSLINRTNWKLELSNFEQRILKFRPSINKFIESDRILHLFSDDLKKAKQKSVCFFIIIQWLFVLKYFFMMEDTPATRFFFLLVSEILVFLLEN